jgi:hypothetical protein
MPTQEDQERISQSVKDAKKLFPTHESVSEERGDRR